MTRNATIVLSIFFIALIVIGVGVVLINLQGETVGDESFNITVNVNAGFYTEGGAKLSVVSQSGEVVESYKGSVQYIAGGQEINWDSFQIQISVVFHVRVTDNEDFDVEKDVQVANVIQFATEDTVNFEKSMESVISQFDVSQFPNASAVIIRAEINIYAFANDIYGVKRDASYVDVDVFIGEWHEPYLNITVPDSDSTDDPVSDEFIDGYRCGYGEGHQAGWHGANSGPYMLEDRLEELGYRDPQTDWERGYNVGFEDGYNDGYQHLPENPRYSVFRLSVYNFGVGGLDAFAMLFPIFVIAIAVVVYIFVNKGGRLR